MPTRRLTPALINTAKADAGADRTLYWDTDVHGLGLMVTATGAKSYVFQFRVGKGRKARIRRMTIETVDQITLTDARHQADEARQLARKGLDPLAKRRQQKEDSESAFEAVADAYLKEHKHLRTADDTRRVLMKHVHPTFAKRQVASIARSEVRKLQREIVESSGDRIADHVVGIMRRIFAWYAADHDDFRNPIVRGMARVKPRERMRQRILTDAELRAVWDGAEALGYPVGKMAQFLLLTACRRTEVAGMMRTERQGPDWTIPAGRHKSKRDFLLPLSADAVGLLDSLPTIGRKGFVFTLTGNASFQRYSAGKTALDKACGVTNWTLHDLRRTARSLMSRSGVDPDHAERALGHVIPGIRGIYDLYEYRDEKAAAFAALAGQIRIILANEPGKVIPLRQVASE